MRGNCYEKLRIEKRIRCKAEVQGHRGLVSQTQQTKRMALASGTPPTVSIMVSIPTDWFEKVT